MKLKYLMLSLLALSLPGFAASQLTASSEEYQLLKTMYAVNQMWALGQDYLHGTTVPQDLTKAYAWLSLYQRSLPESYPGLDNIISDLRTRIDDEQLNKGDNLIELYAQKYKLDFRLSELDLNHIHVLQESQPQFVFEEEMLDLAFLDLIASLEEKGQQQLAEKLVARMEQVQAQAESRPLAKIVYGKLMIAGPEDPQNVIAQFPVFEDGYFLGLAVYPDKSLEFSLSGYQQVKLKLKPSTEKVINAGVIKMLPVEPRDKASIVGMLALRNNDVNAVLQILPANLPETDEIDPWWWSKSRVTVLPSGELYATDLTPDCYRLAISQAGKTILFTEIKLKPGEVKDIGTVGKTFSINHDL